MYPLHYLRRPHISFNYCLSFRAKIASLWLSEAINENYLKTFQRIPSLHAKIKVFLWVEELLELRNLNEDLVELELLPIKAEVKARFAKVLKSVKD